MLRLTVEQIPQDLMSSMLGVEKTVNKAGFEQSLRKPVRYVCLTN